MDRYPLYPQLSRPPSDSAAMKVWVDCTAAAHPLVLRPIIERLEAQGHEVFVTAREYGQTLGVLERLGIPLHGGRQPRRRLDAGQGAGGGRALGSGWRSCVWERRPRPGARPRLGRPRGRLRRSFRIPSAQMQDYEFAGLQRRISFRVARRVLVPDAIPLERLRRIGAKERKLLPLSRA